MTMINTNPALKNSKRLHCYSAGYGGSEGFGGVVMSRYLLEGYECYSQSLCLLGSDTMAEEDESRLTETTTTTTTVNNEEGSTVQDEGWLQLGIGGHAPSNHHQTKLIINQQVDSMTGGGPAVELNLLPGGHSHDQHQVRAPFVAPAPPLFQVPEFRPMMTNTSLLLQQQQYPPGAAIATVSSSSSSIHHHHQDINWTGFIRPNYLTPTISSSSLMQPGPFLSRPFQIHAGGVDVAAGPSSDFRVTDPPRRPHSGVWFMLQASRNQTREPFLPQIPKCYLRIKDGRMTVRLLMKYLVNKLRLDSESEIEIRCKGQQLLPFLTLQHVRDSIWRTTSEAPPPPPLTLLPDSSTASSSSSSTSAIDHLMVLCYARSTTA